MEHTILVDLPEEIICEIEKYAKRERVTFDVFVQNCIMWYLQDKYEGILEQ